MLNVLPIVALLLSSPEISFGAKIPEEIANVTLAFSKAHIVPKVINLFAPRETLNITFTNSAAAENVTVITGSLLTSDQTSSQPHFALGDSQHIGILEPLINTTRSYVVVMIDPDAPTPQMPNASEALHFVGGNYTANSSGELFNSSAALVEYIEPEPQGSDPHRYIILVYDQSRIFSTIAHGLLANVSSIESRLNFSVAKFARITGLGSPIAGNFFLEGGQPASNSSTSGDSSAAGAISSAGFVSSASTNASATAGISSSNANQTITVTTSTGLSATSVTSASPSPPTSGAISERCKSCHGMFLVAVVPLLSFAL